MKWVAGWCAVAHALSFAASTHTDRPTDCSLPQAYNDKQVQQLTRLIEVTRTDLSKADRQKVRWHCTAAAGQAPS